MSWSRRLPITVLSAAFACASSCSSSGDSPETVGTGMRLTIRWDSALDISTFSISARDTNGVNVLAPAVIPVPLTLDPPGPRDYTQDIALASAEGARLTVRAEGLDADGKLIGSGAADMVVLANELVAVSVRLRPGELPPPVDCTKTPDDPACMEPPPPPPTGPRTYHADALAEQHTNSITFVDVPGATLSFKPGSAGETWLVFMSGLLRSTDPGEITAEMRLMVNGREVDLFGHQTRGVTDNWAGFLRFERVTGSADMQVITPQFRAETGTTAVSNLRVVAALVPAGADLQVAEADEVMEASGAALSLGAISFTPSRAGDYIVMGQLSQSELPSTDTVQSWIEDGNAHLMHPLDDRGARFSNGRSSWQPMFSAFRSRLDGSQASFTLRGTSSAVTGASADWWDQAYPFRRPITAGTMAGTAVPAAYSMRLVIPHAAMVTAGHARPDGADLRVVATTAAGSTELDRVLDPASGWNRDDTAIWFQTPADAANAGATFALYYGNPAAGAPPADPAHVFVFYDDFAAANVLDPAKWTTVSGTPVLGRSGLVIGPGTSISSVASFAADTRFEAMISLSTDPSSGLAFWGAGLEGTSLLRGLGFLSRDQQYLVSAAGITTPVQLVTPTQPHLYAFERSGTGAVHFYQDATPLSEHGSGALIAQVLPIVVGNDSMGESISYQWMRVRSFASPEPQVVLGDEASVGGSVASRWRGRKLIAFRADAFAAAEYSESLGLSTVDTPDLAVKNMLATAVPVASTDYLVIQSMRVSGAGSDTGRKSGVIRAGGAAVLETSHKITRDGSSLSGYHHNAAVAQVLKTGVSVVYENALRSPDGIAVDAADSVIIVLRYPPQ